MKLNILESKAKKLVFEIEGVDHTFCNALKDQLQQEKNVEVATYNIDHPLIGVPKFFLIVESGDPKDTLVKAVDDLKKKNSDLVKQVSSF